MTGKRVGWLQFESYSRLSDYFGCGWPPFLPYIVFYLGYAAVDGPIHSGSSSSHSFLPSLLDVFWLLHGLHAVLVATLIAGKVSLASPPWSRLRPSHGVAGLLLIFVAVPGLYLEFPSDPVAHLGRIFEWSHTAHLTAHGNWTKFSYFFAYSLTTFSGTSPAWPLLNGYYLGIVLLFCWQNFRLAEALRLDAPTSRAFAILQLVILGNGTFSFHRYYGISSTLLAQIGVLALQRTVIAYLDAPGVAVPTRGRLLTTLLAESVLIGVNHVQGLMLAATGAGSIILWKILAQRRPKLRLTMLLIACAGSALMIWMSADWPSLAGLRQAGWLTSAGTFRLLADTPASDRVLELLGPLGILGLLLGLGLFRHRSAAAWLMVAPWIVLCLPLTSIPLAAFLATAGAGVKGDNIILFSRLFFAVPLALPFAWLLSKALRVHGGKLGTAALILLLLGLTAPPEFGRHHYNRFWHAAARTPDDLQFKPLDDVAPSVAALTRQGDEKKLLGATGLSFYLAQLGNGVAPFQRRIEAPPATGAIAQEQNQIHDFLRAMAAQREILVLGFEPGAFYSFGSQAGRLSGHWSPFETTLNSAGAPELHAAAIELNFRERRVAPDVWMLTNFAITTPQP